MDSAINAAAGGEGPKAETIMSDTPGVGSSGNVLTRKPGETRGRKTLAQLKAEKEAADIAAATAPPDPLLVALLSQATDILLGFARKYNWSLPISGELKNGELVYSHEAWRRQVAETEIALVKKYGAEFASLWAAEIALGVLVVPWAFGETMSMLKRQKEAKKAKADAEKRDRPSSTGDRTVVSPFQPRGSDSGNVGLRQNNADEGANGARAAQTITAEHDGGSKV